MRLGRGRQLLLGVAALLPTVLCLAGPVTAEAVVPPSVEVRQGQTVQVDIGGDAIVGRPVDVTVRAANPAGDANQGSLTISLPGNPSVEIVSASAPGARVYQPGQDMYNFGTGKQAPIRVPAVELYLNSWPTGVGHELKLRLTASGPYSILARASFRRTNGTFLHLPASGATDQQGATSRQLDITPRQPVQPTTPPPKPTIPPIPTVAPPPAQPAPPAPTEAPAKPTEPAPKPAEAIAKPTEVTGPEPAAKPGEAPTKPGEPQQPSVAQPTSKPSSVGSIQSTPSGLPPTPLPPTPAPSSDNGPSVPLLLAGLGIMVLGVAIGLVAVILVLRRRTPSPGATSGSWPGFGGPYGPAGYGPAGYGPSGTGRMPGAQGGMAGGTPYGTPSYPGSMPPTGAPPSGTQPWIRGAQAGRDESQSWPGTPDQAGGPSGRPPAPPAGSPLEGTTPPWDRPATPPWLGQASQPPASESSRGPAPPTVWRPTTGDGSRAGAPPPANGPEGTDLVSPITPAGERYTQRTLVGQGGMGSVYRAYDSRLQRWVALKIMHADLGPRHGFVDRFIREAQVAALLEHPNIVTVYDIEQVGNSIQMVMSWIEGQDLQHILEREGALQPERIARLLDQMAAALDHAHLRERPVLHRDIKPSNIMVTPSERVILTDFGIARLIGDVSLTMTGQMVGTPAFMAPEVVQGEPADARADLYALGVVLYQMLTGRAPFRAETPLALMHAHVHTPPPLPRAVVPNLPPGVDRVLAQALAKNPAERYQTAGALAAAFRAALGLR
ncbi:MAG: protein kinase [Chloroflexota bacterium]